MCTRVAWVKLVVSVYLSHVGSQIQLSVYLDIKTKSIFGSPGIEEDVIKRGYRRRNKELLVFHAQEEWIQWFAIRQS